MEQVSFLGATINVSQPYSDYKITTTDGQVINYDYGTFEEWLDHCFTFVAGDVSLHRKSEQGNEEVLVHVWHENDPKAWYGKSTKAI